MPLILILRPLERPQAGEPGLGTCFGIVGAELKRVASLGQFMTTNGTVRSSQVKAWEQQEGSEAATVSPQHPDAIPGRQKELYELATTCEELRAESLYVRYANRKVFRHEEDFWATKEKTVRQHVKRMADRRLIRAVGLADMLDIPILYARERGAARKLGGPARAHEVALHLTDRLQVESNKEVTPVMNFRRHGEGITYQLQLRINGRLVADLPSHQPVVLAHEPGLFVLDQSIYALGEGFSSQLLLPFIGKQQVEIPRKIENDYFHRFILKQVARAEINAEGFDITDVSQQPRACLTAESAIDGRRVLSLRFRYGSLEYASESKSNGRVTLTETADGCCFVRQLRNRDEECRLSTILRELTGEGSTVICFASLAAMIEWLRAYAPKLRAQGFDVVQPSDHIYYIGPLSVERSDSWQGDWLQTDVTVVIERPDSQAARQPGDKIRIPFLDLRDTILRGEQEYLLPTGERLLIPREWLQRYSDLLLIGMSRGKGFQRHRSQVGGEELRNEGLEAACARPRDTAVAVGVSTKLKATLRPYQQKGLQWLWQNFAAQTGCCLSDEMGLGKTLQTIALLLQYKDAARGAPQDLQPSPGMLFSDEEMRGEAPSPTTAGRPFPYRTSLVVAPASVVHNWRNELTRFAPSLSVMTYTGYTAKRKDKRSALMSWDVVLTSYRTLLNDIADLAQNEFGIVVFDESQAFKTATSQIHQAVTQLRALHRMALSGTPVQNNLQELWSLMNVLNPNLLGDARSFQDAFVSPIAAQMEDSRSQLLRRLIAPYFLRRTKEEVLADLPERQDKVVVCTMTDEQARQYAEELSKARNEWLDTGRNTQGRQIHILAALQRLRHIANGEGKLRVVFDHLENLRPTRHKVLIFSEYVSLLQQVGVQMTNRGWTFDMLTGQTQEREQVIAHFQQSSDCQFFLISLKAGGVGLNITAADYVFLLDPWWNLAAEEQAIARAHRIGQQRSVFVYRFVSAGTLEEQILTLQDRKQSLIDSVMPFICK